MEITLSNQPFIIAEVSGNHNGSLQRAKDLVRAAATAGVSAIKFQTYTAETMTISADTDAFVVSQDHLLWGGKTLFDLYDEAHTPWEWHKELFDLARELGIVAFSTPFDLSAVEFLEELDVPMYKIASLEINDHELISAVSAKGKPVILSTGAANVSEITAATEVAINSGASQVIVLKCTSAYPCDPADSNLLGMETLRKLTGCEVGLSDHSLGIAVSVAAVALGAVVIEKHITLDRNDGGVDSAFSLTPNELADLVLACNAAYASLGTPALNATISESESYKHKRSLYVVTDVRAGDIISRENVRAIRPNGGLPPFELTQLIGKKFLSDAKRGDPLTPNLVIGKSS